MASELASPAAIQHFLDSVPYATDHRYRCPAQVVADRAAHCFDGATFAAAALRQLGHAPRLVDLRAERDDDHVIAVYTCGGRFGAISKSNFVGLRFREPIHRSLRELVMTYFELYFNVAGEKTLRAYSAPVDLRRFDALDWTNNLAAMETIALRLDKTRHFPLLSRAMVRKLTPVDERSYTAGLMGADQAGLYEPASCTALPSGASTRGL
jgi:hypothetical protein